MSELSSHKNIESTEFVTTTSDNNNGDFKPFCENDNVLGGSLSSSISSLASSSGGSVKSGIPKPVSIKHATHSDSQITTPSTSRIGRLCGNQHKPSLPSSPVQSNLSAVLTEDTDSFIIGQKVWVSGTKPGHIAFIGETQFAPGEWAGIALDEPIGKNDGSVGGIRYFQCEPKKGVFARLTRLTRFPLAQDGMGSGETCSTVPSVANGIRRSPISPTGSTRGNLKSKTSINGSNISLASGVLHSIDYRVGDRVIIKSSQGSKVGTVKFIGSTEFAKGEWVGVELDEPRGKNDGSVNGKRYFECCQNFGLFAPVSKVSKSPSKVKPNACQIHPSSGLPPTGILKRTHSKESMLSNLSVTSASSNVRMVRLGVTSTPKKLAPKVSSTPVPSRTALQDVLKEKQLHIEQLLKERDLERVDILKAANQAEEAEQRLTSLHHEYKKYRSKCEGQLQDHLAVINKLREDRNELIAQLDEEKRKTEDLTFRLAESSISKEDVEVAYETNLKKIKELEEKLHREKDRVEALESNANKLFEAEENLIRAKEEIDLMRKQLQETRDKQSILEVDNAPTTVLISSLQHEVDQYKSDMEERDEMIAVLKQEISKMTTDFRKQIDNTLQQKTGAEALCKEKIEESKTIKFDLDQVNVFLQNEISELEKVTVEKLTSETLFEKEREKLNIQLNSKNSDLENALQDCNHKMGEIKKKQTEMESIIQQTEKKNKKLEELQTQVSEQMIEKTRMIENYQQQILNFQNQLKILTSELENSKVKHDAIESNTKEMFSKLTEEKQQQINELERISQHTKERNKELSDKYNALSKDFENKCNDIESLSRENEVLTKKGKEFNLRIVELQKIPDILKERELLIQSLQTELQTTKIDLESVTNSLSQYQTDMSDVEFSVKQERDDLKESLKAKIIELDDIKKRFSENTVQKDLQIQKTSKTLSEKQEDITRLQEDMETLKEKHDKLIKKTVEKYSVEIKNKDEHLANLVNEIRIKDNEIKDVMLELKLLMENLKQQSLENKKLNDELDLKTKFSKSQTVVITEAQNEIKNQKEMKCQLQEKCNSLEKELLKLENLSARHNSDLELKLNEIQQSEISLKQKDEEITSLKTQISTLQENNVRTTKDLECYRNTLNDIEKKLRTDRGDLQELDKQNELEIIKQEMEKKISYLEETLSEVNLECQKQSHDIKDLNKKNNELLDETSSSVNKTLNFFDDTLNKNISLSECISKWEETVKNKDNEIASLLENMKNISDEYQNLSNSHSNLRERFEQLSINGEDNEKLLSEYQNAIKMLRDENEKLKFDLNNVSTAASKLSDNISDLNTQLKIKNQDSITKSELQNKVDTLEITVDLLQKDKSLCEEKLAVQKSDYEQIIEKLTESEMVLRNEGKLINDPTVLNKNISEVIIKLADKDKIITLKNEEINKTKGELEKMKCLKNEVDFDNMGKSEASVADQTNAVTNYQQILEEKVFAENQITFLNSIIADMQKKNQEQQARIEILEMGYSASATEELTTLGFNREAKIPAPRMYCDICEEFDLHETEDCPTQGDQDLNIGHHNLKKKSKQKLLPRSYCEICEEFGHDVQDCVNVDREY